ncbi:MAG: hypothetical protein IPF96_01200 [Rhodobacter sp.]|nr:hypothetical protein [Rhodobacter sp.]
MVYRVICDAPEAWGRADGAPIPQSHSAVRAPGANDALMMYQASKALREGCCRIRAAGRYPRRS